MDSTKEQSLVATKVGMTVEWKEKNWVVLMDGRMVGNLGAQWVVLTATRMTALKVCRMDMKTAAPRAD